MSKKVLSGGSLAGGNPSRERVENDYYATPYETTENLLNKVEFKGDNFLEPCIGGGHIAEAIKKHYENANVFGCDIVDRGYPDTKVVDFLTHEFENEYDNIITNPPYAKAQEFLEKSMKVVKDGGKIAMFLKIQFLEGIRRKEMFENYPPKYIYVFSKRQNPWRNGSPVDENGKAWSSTMCFAWFVWEKGSKSEPIVRWL